MQLLVLGGTHFVGRAVAETALARGVEVTLLNRGRSRAAAGAELIVADRTDPEALRSALGNREWDAVIDTWSGAPRVVGEACGLLDGRAGHFGYVSSRSVYRWPMPRGADEQAPVVDGDPDEDGDDDYAAAKRGGELAALKAFGDRTLLARAGLVLGPYEDVGRLPWWLRRIERGGRVLAPGDPARRLQYIDARDLAAWMLTAAADGVVGTFNAVSRPGHTTMGELLQTAVTVTGSDAELIWTAPEVLEEVGISPWTEMPIWLPDDAEYGGMHNADVSAAHDLGLTCRPVQDTIADTWTWLQLEGDPTPRREIGLAPAKEQHALNR
ncbi:MAG TPA: NAD-dependent epimerase/dehydratase family protein [Streptosporangiaceae bacterium]|nr:NAD-dependent epimerase/dehydratase family protein [Streptosporangiaceae bacterium]